MTMPLPPVALAAAMRNEGPYILEWLAYHQAVGFGSVLICSNDCTDGSDALLDRLGEAGEISHIHNTPAPGQSPQDAAMERVFAALQESEVEWLCHIDSDEFVQIAHGAGHIDDLMQHCGGADVIALVWRMFGDNGHGVQTLPVLPNFTACEPAPDPETTKFKSLFRFRKFGHANDHRPVAPKSDDIRVVNAAGVRLRNNIRGNDKRARYHPTDRAIAPGAACINHYATRAADDFLMKNDRGDGQGAAGRKYHLGSAWHRRANRNEVQDRAILRHWPAVEAGLARLRALPGVAEAERASLSWHRARHRAILTPETRRHWGQPADALTSGAKAPTRTFKES
ncbi:glycosyltransferase family 2 protein [Rhodobacteraceae bacterium D3-12]|nr:glycosyltransferase family 2 protein [Rhodobacteraceae bacterium D3-12]